MILAAIAVPAIIAFSPIIQKNESENIRGLISDLYSQPIIGSFTYFNGRGRSITYWQSYYSKFYTHDVVKIIISNASKSPEEPICFLAIDPRYFPAAGEYSEVKKVIIGKPHINGNKGKIVVYYTTTDGLNVHKCTTVYFLEKTKQGWKIEDQWLGAINYNGAWMTVRPDLLQSIQQ